MKTKIKKYVNRPLQLIVGIICIGIISFVVNSCQKDVNDFNQDEINPDEITEECYSDDNMMYFSSIEDLQLDVKALSSGEKESVKSDEWSSREVFIRKKLKDKFSENTLKSAGIDINTIEVEDSIIQDPFLLKVVNGFREVQVKDKVYKLTEFGTFICTEESRFKLRELLKDEDFRQKMAILYKEKAQTQEEVDTRLKTAMPPDGEYAFDDIYYEYPLNNTDPFGGSGGSTTTTPSFSSTTELTEDIIMNECDESSKTLAGELIGGILGYSVNCENNFSSNKRVKTVFWSQNWGFYNSVGIKVKMQSKVLGIWWAKQAEELKLGWESIYYEIKTSYKPEYLTFTINQEVFNTQLSETFSSFSSFTSFMGHFGFSTSEAPSFIELHNAVCEKNYYEWSKQNHLGISEEYQNLDYFIKFGDYNKIWNKIKGEGTKAGLNYFKSIVKPELKTELEKLLAEKKNISINFVDENFRLTRLLLPAKAIKRSYSNNKMEHLFDYSKSKGFEFGVRFSGPDKFFLVKFHKAPNSFKILEGSSIYGAAKYNGEWRGSKIVKKEE